jgi:hypothetical protein
MSEHPRRVRIAFCLVLSSCILGCVAAVAETAFGIPRQDSNPAVKTSQGDVPIALTADYTENLRVCLQRGRGCDRQALTPDDQDKIAIQEYSQIFRDCLQNAASIGCRRQVLTPEDERTVEIGDQVGRLSQCYDGSFCNRSNLNPQDLENALAAAYDHNLLACLQKSAGCRSDQLDPQHRTREASYDANFLRCLTASPDCKAGDLKADDQVRARAAVYRRAFVACAKGLPSCRQAALSPEDQKRIGFRSARPSGPTLALRAAPAPPETTAAGEEQKRLASEAIRRADSLAEELAGARRELATLQSRLGSAADQARVGDTARAEVEEHARAAARERERADGMALALAAARRDLAAADARATEGAEQAKAAAVLEQQVAAREKEHRESLSEELAAARRDLDQAEQRARWAAEEAQAARSIQTNADELKELVARERRRADSLAEALAGAHRELADARASQSSEKEEAARTAQASSEEQRKAATRERERANALEQELAAARQEIQHLKSVVVATDPRPGQLTAVSVPATSSDPAPNTSSLSVEHGRILARVGELIRLRDVSGARLLLERAVETGDSKAAFMLAETYDPRVLARWGVRMASDPQKARQLYEKASAGGIAEARERMEGLSAR